eukprot:600084-Prorocentrum_minimum.AAC.1
MYARCLAAMLARGEGYRTSFASHMGLHALQDILDHPSTESLAIKYSLTATYKGVVLTVSEGALNSRPPVLGSKTANKGTWLSKAPKSPG